MLNPLNAGSKLAVPGATVTSKQGGLPETFDNKLFINKVNENELFKIINFLIKNKKFRIKHQKFNWLNVKHKLIDKINTSEFDFISSDILQINNSDKVQFIISIFKLSLFGNDYVERKKVINYLYNQNFFENNLNLNIHCNDS